MIIIVCICQYKYLDSSPDWLPIIPDNDDIPDRMITSPIQIDYFQSVDGPVNYAKLVDHGELAFNGKTFLL